MSVMGIFRQLRSSIWIQVYFTSSVRRFEETATPLPWYVVVLSLRGKTRWVVM
jgi:hypothetical protein